ncbi:DUF1801 domain-containing protein [Gemmatimonas sp.]|uniref:DUF1801 domain-containing protein n=1 Tax=Gemmatimonas sp. TaxID=1962908 RepID=UPI00286CBDED|nr:DUF1801 domain-containing protein [Gemmatimonas sp.]
MYEAKTKPTTVSVDSYLAAIADDTRREDCRALTALMQRLSGHEPTMWGTSIVGFGKYHYKYASGHEGDSCLVGYSSRKGDISVYLLAGYDTDETRALLAQLGRHKIGKACLYIRRLSDVQLPVLEQLIARSIAETKARYPA